MHRRAHVVRVTCVVATVLVGCASSQPPPARVAKKAAPAKVELTSAQAPAPRTAAKVPSAQVVIAPDIREICHIEDVETAPKFDFDRSDLTLEVRQPLQQLAECLTTGPLKGQRVLLTGRADPRGEDEYNMSLGSSRAASVGNYLRDLGVPAMNVSETSRGELDATGIDEAGWTYDRRVDVERAK